MTDSKGIRLPDVLLTDILPDIFSDAAKTEAFALAERSVRRMIYAYAERTMVYYKLAELDDAALDLMAAELKTQYYSSDFDRETKARLILNTLRWHMLAGTRSAVEELILAVFDTDKVSEWFEYDGEPFYFRVNTEENFSPDRLAEFRRMISNVKNTAVTLDSVFYNRELSCPLLFFGGVTVEETVGIGCKSEEAEEIGKV